jgi:hypothetical protein
LPKVILAALCFALLSARAAGAGSSTYRTREPLWHRTLAAASTTVLFEEPVLRALDSRYVIVRSGSGVAAIDIATGATRWYIPRVERAIVALGNAVLSRSDVVFSVRGNDAAVLWKVPCYEPRFLVSVGARVVTRCGLRSVVLDAASGATLASRDVDSGDFFAARPLGDDYVAADERFDGAWSGTKTHIVDARTGEYKWSATDAQIVGATATTLSLSPLPSMLPWGASGTVAVRRLADGSVVHTTFYDVPKTESRGGYVTLSSVAAYVTNGGALYRFALAHPSPGTLLPGNEAAGQAIGSRAVALGASGFIAEPDVASPMVYVSLDRARPATATKRSSFSTRPLGRFAAVFSRGAQTTPFLRLGHRVVLAAYGYAWLYDELGHAEIAAHTACDGQQTAATTAAHLLVLCEATSRPTVLTAYERWP